MVNTSNFSALTLVSTAWIGFSGCTTTGTLTDSLDYRLTPVITGLNLPVKGAFQKGDDDHIYALEKDGRIIKAKIDSEEKTVVLDIRSRVYAKTGKTGLLGLAFHPDFIENGRLFVNYTAMRQNQLITRVSEFYCASAAGIDASSEKIILEIDLPYAGHNGGEIQFGPKDGYLYFSTGDGGSTGDPGNRAQNLDSLLGKILRIDINFHKESGPQPYSIPADNPVFANRTKANEIYAYGLRNPWRFSFDRTTGLLWAGDVGHKRREEINIIALGGNYGWRVMEGTLCYNPVTNCSENGITRPIYEYGRTEGISVIGGFVYRGQMLSDLYGKYIYGDFGSGNIWALSFESGKVVSHRLLIKSGMQISAFAENNTGELFVLSFQTGTIHRLEK